VKPRTVNAGPQTPIRSVSGLIAAGSAPVWPAASCSVADEKAAADVLGMKGSTYPAKKILAQTRKLGSRKIARSVQLLADADLQLRGTIDWPDELVLEVLIARLAALSPR